ncbi:MAG: anaerobic ribonucleoside-triphosphate reductase activating protein [Candidatus Bathyarchaeota archaeon]|jgi:pyruvate formate lyase activating enzyme
MKFSGIQKTSLIDFPDRVATVLFATGCNLRCPYCQNWRIVVDPSPPFLSAEKVVQILEDRKMYLNAVVITGGEPTIYADLPEFLKKLKEAGFDLKLDTNGFSPRVLKECLPYVDYVALDVKTSLSKYELLGAKHTNGLIRTVEILKEGTVEYEFRATVVPGFVDKEDIHRIGEIVKGGRLFVFQKFIPSDTLDKTFNDMKPYPLETIKIFSEHMKPYVDKVILRV